MSDIEQAELWDCLYLRIEEIAELSEFVELQKSEPFLFPMMIMAAHTGARRSEIARSQKRDFDFNAGTVLIREKKRAKGRATNRSVPMSEELAKTMQVWLREQPGPAAFTHLGDAITPERAGDELERTLAGSTWEKLRGWHVLRHSFVSNLASRSVDPLAFPVEKLRILFNRVVNTWEIFGHVAKLLPRCCCRNLCDIF